MAQRGEPETTKRRWSRSPVRRPYLLDKYDTERQQHRLERGEK